MNKRLFWKILFIFWGIFFVTFQATWAVFVYYEDDRRNDPSYYHAPTKVKVIAQIVRMYGKEEAQKFILNLPEEEQNWYSISLIYGAEENLPMSTMHGMMNRNRMENQNRRTYREAVRAPDRSIYSVAFIDKRTPDFMRIFILNMPIPLVLMGIFAGLLFSLLLAWNLIKPMKLLQQGFSRVSQGDLSVRLFSKVSSRHDELSDLAHDFDKMVEKLGILMLERQILLHDVSHELRTPLARLQLAIGLAQQNKNNIDTSLQRIALESERLDQLIGEILVYSQSETNEQFDDYFDLKELLQTVIDDANYEAKSKNITINFSVLTTTHSVIKGSSEQIHRATENIIRNALRFSEPTQTVQVILSEVGPYLQIEVNDQGPGVDEDKLSSIFEPFVRIQSAKLGKGYGLGLAIARKAVNAHNGIITANNLKMGGLQVIIKLPYWK